MLKFLMGDDLFAIQIKIKGLCDDINIEVYPFSESILIGGIPQKVCVKDYSIL
jgi:hypothetical protein